MKQGVTEGPSLGREVRKKRAKFSAATGLVVALVQGLGGCAVPVPGAHEEHAAVPASEADMKRAVHELFHTPAGGGHWDVFRLPGKLYAPFARSQGQGRPALGVKANRSVSVLRQQFSPPLAAVDELVFSWKVDALPAGADLKDAALSDAPVRILLAFEGDRSRWNARAHRMSDLSRLLTGEPLPYATLSYVWSPNDPPESVLHNPRTDRIRKVVVDSGTAHLGQWREHRRDVRADFIRAFGEEPGPLAGVALMTDTDNTASALQAWYGPMRLVAPLATR